MMEYSVPIEDQLSPSRGVKCLNSFLVFKSMWEFSFTGLPFFFPPQVCILWKWFLVETAINTGKSTGKYYDVGHAKGKTRWLLSSPSQTCRPDFESMLFSASTPLLCLHFNLWVSQVTSLLHGLGKLELVPCVSATARALGSVWCL